MKVALIYNQNQRIAIGERCKRVLETYKNLEILDFDFKNIQTEKRKLDLYLRVDDGDYTAIPRDLRPSAWWVSDTHLKKPYKKIKQQIDDYDYVFCCQKEACLRLNKDTGKTTHWIPWACDEVPFNFEFSDEKGRVWDICFIGTTGKYSLRKVVLELIKMNYPNSFIGRVPYYELLDYYQKAKIVVNYSINNDINARIFEAMSAGCLVITNRIKNNGFGEIFKADKHLVVFDDILKELKAKIDYYLKNAEEREKIAKAGFAYVKDNHTYRHRLLEMFTIMGYRLQE